MAIFLPKDRRFEQLLGLTGVLEFLEQCRRQEGGFEDAE
jgi:hypothetical protein